MEIKEGDRVSLGNDPKRIMRGVVTDVYQTDDTVKYIVRWDGIGMRGGFTALQLKKEKDK